MIRSAMQPRERVLAAIRRQDFDVFPAIAPTSVANLDCMQLTGTFMPKVHTDAQQMAELATAGHTVLGFDSVMPYVSIHLEAAALGCQVDWGNHVNMPMVTGHALHHVDDLSIPSNFPASPLPKQLLKAIRLLKKQFDSKVAIIGKVIGPWSLACHLYGVEKLLLDVILEPEKVKRFLGSLLEVPVSFAKAQFEAGADIVTWADHITADIISPKLYEELVFPLHKAGTAKLLPYGPLILHTCGNVMDRLHLVRETGFQVFHIDSRNNIPEAVSIAGDRIVLTGSVNNPQTLAQGNPAAIHREVKANLDAGITLISPECAIPFKVSNHSLLELVNTTHRCRTNSFQGPEGR